MLILLALTLGPSHGYGVKRLIRKLTHESFELTSSTLYGRLRRMTEYGLVAEVEAGADETDRRRGKVYALTWHGRRQIKRELARLKAIQELATQLGVDEWRVHFDARREASARARELGRDPRIIPNGLLPIGAALSGADRPARGGGRAALPASDRRVAWPADGDEAARADDEVAWPADGDEATPADDEVAWPADGEAAAPYGGEQAAPAAAEEDPLGGDAEAPSDGDEEAAPSFKDAW